MATVTTKAQKLETKKWAAEQALTLINNINGGKTLSKEQGPWIPDEATVATMANVFYVYVSDVS